MIEYLMNYGVKGVQKQSSFKFEDLNVDDRLALQDQINMVRKRYFQLMEVLDDVQARLLAVSKRIAQRSKLLIESNGATRSNAIFQSDNEYLEADAEREALKAGMKMINEQLDFYKNDLRILNSVFYNKF
jgi:hypothetical protein